MSLESLPLITVSPLAFFLLREQAKKDGKDVSLGGLRREYKAKIRQASGSDGALLQGADKGSELTGTEIAGIVLGCIVLLALWVGLYLYPIIKACQCDSVGGLTWALVIAVLGFPGIIFLFMKCPGESGDGGRSAVAPG